MGDFYGAAYVAAHIGTTTTSLHNWLNADDFPQPESVHYAATGKVSSRGWSAHQLPELRSWVENRLDLEGDDATAHWTLVDADVVNKRRIARDHVSENQLFIDLDRGAA